MSVSSAGPDRRPHLVVAVTYPIDPPLGGGQVRAYNLYRGLAGEYDIELVTLGPAGSREQRVRLAPGLWEHRVPKSSRHAELELAREREAGTVVTDIAMTELYRHTPDYMAALRDAVNDAHAVVACHPYVFPALREVTSLPLWYEAQDVEAALKRSVLGTNEESQRLLAAAEKVEHDCCQDADLVWACSEEDRQELIERYDLSPDRVLVVPNGVSLDETSFVSPSTRRGHRRRLRMARPLAVFVASWHGPNVAGARWLLKVATEVHEVDFLILGSVGSALAGGPLPPNLTLTGTVSHAFKQTVLSVADMALNPVTTGSGTNLKMLDYFAAGIPVIATSFGARGLGVKPQEHYLPAELREFAAAVRTYRGLSCDHLDTLALAARTFVETRGSWDVITDALLTEIRGAPRRQRRRRANQAERLRSTSLPAS